MRGARTRRIAVVGSGAAAESVAREYAELISGLAGIPAKVLDGADHGTISSAEYGAILLVHPGAGAASAARRLRAATGLYVLSDQDATAIALTGALLATLARRGRAPRDVRVVIAGAERLPGLAPLLIAADVRDVTLWNTADGAVFPLHQIVFGADAVVDLLGALPGDMGGVLAVNTGDDVHAAPCAAAGLLRAALYAEGRAREVDTFHVAAAVLAAVVTPGRVFSRGAARELADLITEAVLASLAPARTGSG
ncbi:hypothetical protein ACFWY9_32420 [Amycolatopsis sp. NPDC059027]|uniref:hypothetical protein n=1 Tax=unclassified Amycolatopsis TaxID=2618356 RepID=UPI00366A637B